MTGGEPGTAGVWDLDGRPVDCDAYAAVLGAEWDLAGGPGAGGDALGGRVRLSDGQARVVALLLDDLAAVYAAEPLGRLARQVAVSVYDRLGV